MAYTPQTWTDGVSKLNATRLGYIESGIEDAAAVADAAQATADAAGVDIVDADIASGAAIAYSKLSLSGSIVNADVSGSAAIAFSKLSGVAPAAGYGTSLPGSPADGDEYILVDSTTAPTYQWRFRYNSSNAGSSKWEFIGGSPAFVEVATTEGTASTSYVDLSTVGPSFTIPRTGTYLATIGASVADSTASATAVAFFALKLGSAASADADAGSFVTGDNIGARSAMRTLSRTATAADVWKLQYKSGTGTQTMTFAKRFISVVPVSVS